MGLIGNRRPYKYLQMCLQSGEGPYWTTSRYLRPSGLSLQTVTLEQRLQCHECLLLTMQRRRKRRKAASSTLVCRRCGTAYQIQGICYGSVGAVPAHSNLTLPSSGFGWTAWSSLLNAVDAVGVILVT